MYLHIVQYNLHQSWGLSHNARKGIGLAAKAVETHGTCGVFVRMRWEHKGKGAVFAAKAVERHGRVTIFLEKGAHTAEALSLPQRQRAHTKQRHCPTGPNRPSAQRIAPPAAPTSMPPT